MDDGVPGTDEALENAYALLDLLSALNGENLTITTKNSDRICGRSDFRSAFVRREIIKSGKKLICTDNPDYNIYDDDPASVLMTKIFDALSIFEHMNISLRLAKSRRANLKKSNMKASGRANYSYSWADVGKSRKLVLNEDEE